MERYYSRETAPLWYHKFLKYFSLPLGAIVTVVRLFSYIDALQGFHIGVLGGLYVIAIAYSLLYLILALITIIGFLEWAPYSWRSVMAIFLINVIYQSFVVWFYVMYETHGLYSQIGALIACLIEAICVAIYYTKRKPLFFEPSHDSSESAPPTDDYAAQWDDLPAPDAERHCPDCGCPIYPGSRSCEGCGNRVDAPADTADHPDR